MNISDLLGTVMQSGMAPSSGRRLQNALGGGDGGILESLGGLMGGQQGSNLGDMLSGALSGSGGGLGGLLGDVLGQAGQAAGGQRNLAMGGLGALVGSLLGGGRRQSMGGGLGGGVMALLGAIAFKALQGSGKSKAQVPLGLLEPRTDADHHRLEQQAEFVLKAMINAAKADGQIDQKEIQRIVGKLQEVGADADGQRYVLTEMQKPIATEALIAAAANQPELAAQVYAASLMAIEVDTPTEKAYLGELADGLGISPAVVRRIEQMVGLGPA